MSEFVNGETLVGQIVRDYPEAAPVLMSIGMHCLGCPASQMESLADAARVHGYQPEDVVKAVNDAIAKKAEEK
ncbi:MAG: DUF1858 domain-containing protein [Clostridia bacterium]|nr:DUF1858 domain-containing protein [Clostridia bacterium]